MSSKTLVDSPINSGWNWMGSLFTTPAPAFPDHDHKKLTLESIRKSKSSSSIVTMKKPQAAPPPQQHVINWNFSKHEVIHVQSVNIQHYTSLRDIIPVEMLKQQQQQVDPWLSSSDAHFHNVGGGGGHSPRARMKNHLVEQAARAYLQPATTEASVSNHFFPWNWQKLMGSTPLTFNLPATTMPKRGFFSRALRYLLGRVRPQPLSYLQLCL